MNMFIRAALFCSSALVITVAHAATPSAESIIEKADAIRNPSQSFVMKVSVSSTGVQDEFSYDVYLKGNTKTLIKTLQPARERGRNMLMLGEDMWAYIPNLNRAVRISLSQKLSGQAANGDISRMRWSGDYDASIDEKCSDDKLWCVYLKANKKGLTYDRLRVWVAKDSFRPEKAEYLSLSDKILKKATYTGYKKMANGERPTEIHIQDAVNENEKSVIKIVSMEVKDNPETMFNQNNLK